MYQRAAKIGVIFNDFPLRGPQRIALRLMNAWAETDGRKVKVFSAAPCGSLTDLVSDKVEVVECRPAIPPKLGSRWRFGRTIRGILESRPVDILFCPGNDHWSVLSAIGRMQGPSAPGIVTHISKSLHLCRRRALGQFASDVLTRIRLRSVDAAVALSPAAIAQADAVLMRKITRYIRLPALDDSAGLRVVTRASGNLIVAAGCLVKEKGFDVALRAFARLEDRTARLVILGDGPQRARLEKLASNLGVDDRVEFRGDVPDIAPFIAKARLLLMSSYDEGFGAVLVEALAAGRPVVSTDCTPAVNDLLIGLPGCHVTPVGDFAALANALDLALALPAPAPRVLADAVEAYRIGPIAAAHLDMFDCVHRARLRGTAVSDEFSESFAYI